MNDWMTSMGAIALMRLDTESGSIQADANSLEVSIDWLKGFPETLFQYFLDQYSVAARETQVLKSLAKSLEKNVSNSEKFKANAKWLNDRVKGDVDRVKEYFPSMSEEIQEIVVTLKEDIEAKEFKAIHQHVFELQQIFQRSEIDRKLTLNWVKATLLAPAAGQASFLNVAKNGLAYTEQQELFRKDYIMPLVWELQLREKWLEGNESEIESLFNVDEKPDYATKWAKERKKIRIKLV